MSINKAKPIRKILADLADSKRGLKMLPSNNQIVSTIIATAKQINAVTA